jgi:hypothetical protein
MGGSPWTGVGEIALSRLSIRKGSQYLTAYQLSSFSKSRLEGARVGKLLRRIIIDREKAIAW